MNEYMCVCFVCVCVCVCVEGVGLGRTKCANKMLRVASDTADFETGQLLILQRSLCPITFCNYKCLNIGLFQNNAVFYTHICYQME